MARRSRRVWTLRLVYWAAQQLGLGWLRLTAAGYQSGSTQIPWTQAAPGDLLLFWGAPAHHIAIYAGGDQMIEEPKPGLNARRTPASGAPRPSAATAELA